MSGPLNRLAALKLAACAVILQAVCLSAWAQSPPPVFQSWLASLQQQGYVVTQGAAFQFNSAYCQQTSYPIFFTCFNSDPQDPYLVPQIPVGSSYSDPAYGTKTSVTTAGGVVADQFFRLATTEAVVFVINLPPTGAYFSSETYMFSRPASSYPKGAVTKRTPDPLRAQIFGSFNNSVDNVVIQRQSGLQFGQGTVAIITTANSSLVTNLSSSFSAVGGDPHLLFPEAMGSNLNLGIVQGSDEFATVMRYSIPEDTTAGNTWRNNPNGNIQVYRIMQPAFLPVTLYGSTPLSAKSYNVNEASHAANVSELSQLLKTWLATEENNSAVTVSVAKTGEQLSKTGVPQSGEVGPYCIAKGTSCASDSQDTDDYKIFKIGKLAANQMYFVDGVNHAVTNNSTLHSVAAQDVKLGTGIASASQTNTQAAGFTTGVLTGSAAAVLQDLGLYAQASASLQNDLPYLFVHLFTRPCTPAQTYCTKSYATTLSTTDLPLADQVTMLERAYVLPGFPNGANPTDLLNPNIIH